MAEADDSIQETGAKIAADMVADVAAGAKDIRQRLGDKLSDAVAEASDSASDMARKLRDSAQTAAASSKEYAADALHGLAETTRSLAGKLGDEDEDGDGGRMAGYARAAAERMEGLSAQVRDLDSGEIVDTTRSAIRDNPVLVIGAAALAGFALARLLKGGSDD